MRLSGTWIGWFASACCAFGPVAALAQPPDPHAAQPERPSVATHAATVAPGWLEIESGWERPREDGRFGDAGLPIAVKLGLASHTQLTVATRVSRPSGGQSLDDVSVGVKWRLVDRGPAGAVAVFPSVTLSTGSASATGETAVGLLAIVSRPLGPLALDVNAGYTRWTGDGSNVPKSEALWAAALSGMVGRFTWVGEVYGYPATSGPAGTEGIRAALAGLSATITPSVVVDVAFAAPIAGPEPRAVIAGIVWNAGSVWRRPSHP